MLKTHYLEIDFLLLEKWILANQGKKEALRLDSSIGTDEDDKTAFNAVFDDFIKKVGLGEDYEEYIQLHVRRSELNIEYLETRQRSLLNQINELTVKIDNFNKTNKTTNEGSIYKTLNILSKMQGYAITPQNIYTLQYFELLKQYNNG